MPGSMDEVSIRIQKAARNSELTGFQGNSLRSASWLVFLKLAFTLQLCFTFPISIPGLTLQFELLYSMDNMRLPAHFQAQSVSRNQARVVYFLLIISSLWSVSFEGSLVWLAVPIHNWRLCHSRHCNPCVVLVTNGPKIGLVSYGTGEELCGDQNSNRWSTLCATHLWRRWSGKVHWTSFEKGSSRSC